MNRAVFDTNVLVAGFLSPDGPPGRIVEWLRAGSVVAVLDDRILAEYAEVLVRPAFCLPAGDVNVALDAIRARAIWAEVGVGYRMLLPDPDDVPFAECATRPTFRWSRETCGTFPGPPAVGCVS
jgi:predicted nucleic acid-binding protein